MDALTQAAQKIILSQEAIIGPLALEQAKQVSGLDVSKWDQHEVSLTGNKTDIVESLIEQYRDFFGNTSVEVCRDAASDVVKDLPSNQLPELLKR